MLPIPIPLGNLGFGLSIIRTAYGNERDMEWNCYLFTSPLSLSLLV